MVLFLACSMDGNAGDETAQGTCPNDHLCRADGICGSYLFIATFSVRDNVIITYSKLY